MKKAKTVIYFDRSGNVAKIKSDAGKTRNNRAAYYLHLNSVEPTFGVKLRRFMRRLRGGIRRAARHSAARYKIIPPAASMPYIGLEAHYD